MRVIVFKYLGKGLWGCKYKAQASEHSQLIYIHMEITIVSMSAQRFFIGIVPHCLLSVYLHFVLQSQGAFKPI